jgi:hypothetical protein
MSFPKLFNLFDLDIDTMSESQIGNLEIEVTQDILNHLHKYVAEKEVFVEDVLFDDPPVYNFSGWSNNFTEHLNRKKAFNTIVDIQEEMAASTKKFRHLRQQAIDELNNWYKRFNNWLKSDAYTNYPHKSKMWNIYKKGLLDRKQTLKIYTYGGIEQQRQSNYWMELKEKCDKIVAKYPWIWSTYFNLIEEDFNKYWAGIDPEEIDEQILLNQGPNDLADCLRDTHVLEMDVYNVKNFKEDPNYLGTFWNYKTEHTIHHAQEVDLWYDEIERTI